MKRNFLRILTATTIVALMGSCSNLLEIKETDFLGGDIALRTVANNESLLMGAYSSFDGEMAIRLNGVFSDELKSGDFYNAQTTHEWQYSADDIGIRDNYTAIDPLYRMVDRVNRIFIALPNAVSTSANDEALKQKIKGEALFLRAYAHFELFKYYCKNYDPAALGMAYMKEPSLKPFERDLMGTYFKNIIDDIEEAKGLLTNTTDVYRANRLAAVALQARVSLYMRNWKDAITYSTEFINAKPLATVVEFPQVWKDKSNAEIGFKIAKTISNTRVGDIFRGRFTKVNNVLQAPGSISWVPSTKLWNSYDQVNDIRFNSYFVDEPILQALAGKPSKIVNKYSVGGYAATDESVNDVKVFRTGEMYLIRAEARAEDGIISGSNSAESDLNTLRLARILNYTSETFSSKDAIIGAIMTERYKELAFVGHRFWDLKRRGLPVQRLSVDAPTPESATLPANDFRFVLPIPNEERLANPLIQQNEGYN